MSNRHRLGVALLIDRPVADEIDGLRRALGDPSLKRIPPHLTLVPPVNVPSAQLGAALDRLRTGAASCGQPLRLTLGPPTSFLPANPVLILPVGGDLDRLAALRDSVFVEPLARSLSWPWVPHVTLADDPGAGQDAGGGPGGDLGTGGSDRIEAAVRLLDGYTASVEIGYVVLLEALRTAEGLRWQAIADADLAPRRLVGRGGLELELTRGRLVDPEGRQLVESAGASLDPVVTGGAGIVVTGRRGGAIHGLATAWRDDAGGHVAVLVAATSRGEGIGSHLLAHVEAAVTDAGWSCPVLAAVGPPAFYRSRSRWSVAL